MTSTLSLPLSCPPAMLSLSARRTSAGISGLPPTIITSGSTTLTSLFPGIPTPLPSPAASPPTTPAPSTRDINTNANSCDEPPTPKAPYCSPSPSPKPAPSLSVDESPNFLRRKARIREMERQQDVEDLLDLRPTKSQLKRLSATFNTVRFEAAPLDGLASRWSLPDSASLLEMWRDVGHEKCVNEQLTTASATASETSHHISRSDMQASVSAIRARDFAPGSAPTTFSSSNPFASNATKAMPMMTRETCSALPPMARTRTVMVAEMPVMARDSGRPEMFENSMNEDELPGVSMAREASSFGTNARARPALPVPHRDAPPPPSMARSMAVTGDTSAGSASMRMNENTRGLKNTGVEELGQARRYMSEGTRQLLEVLRGSSNGAKADSPFARHAKAFLAASEGLHEKFTEKNREWQKRLETGEAEMVMPLIEQTRTVTTENSDIRRSDEIVVKSVVGVIGESGHGGRGQTSKSQSQSSSTGIDTLLDSSPASAMSFEGQARTVPPSNVTVVVPDTPATILNLGSGTASTSIPPLPPRSPARLRPRPKSMPDAIAIAPTAKAGDMAAGPNLTLASVSTPPSSNPVQTSTRAVTQDSPVAASSPVHATSPVLSPAPGTVPMRRSTARGRSTPRRVSLNTLSAAMRKASGTVPAPGSMVSALSSSLYLVA